MIEVSWGTLVNFWLFVGRSGLQQRPRLDTKTLSNAVKVVDRDVLFGPLNSAEIGAIKTGFIRQKFLRPAAIGAQLAHVARNDVSQGAFGRCLHAQCYCAMTLLTLPVLTYIQRIGLIP